MRDIRDIIKLFRNFPLKNDILQGYVKPEFSCKKNDLFKYQNTLVQFVVNAQQIFIDKINNFKSTN